MSAELWGYRTTFVLFFNRINMPTADYTQIGFTKKTHGVAGELKVFIEEHYEDVFLEQERVFLELRGQKQPFFIEHIRGGGDLIVKFEELKNREEALLLQSKAIFLPSQDVPQGLEPASPGLEYAGTVGFMLHDRSAGQIGRIEEVMDMPQQEMAMVHYQGREVLVPLNSQFVQAVDPVAKTVTVDLPEGLLTL